MDEISWSGYAATSVSCWLGRSTITPLSNFDAGTDQGDQVWGVDRSPPVLGRLDQLVGHGEAGRFGSGALGDLGPQANRRGGRLDRVRRLEMDPVLGGEAEEREQHFGVIDDLGDGLGPLRALVSFVASAARNYGRVGLWRARDVRRPSWF